MEKQDRLNRLRDATGLNFASSFVSFILSPVTGSPVYDGEKAHSLSDGIVHLSRWFAEKLGIDQETKRFKNFLRGSLLIPAGFLGYTSIKTGVDLIEGVQYEPTITDKVVNSIGGTAIAGLNTQSYIRLKGTEDHSHASFTSFIHQRADVVVAYGYAIGLWSEAAGIADTGSFFSNVLFSGAAALHLTLEARDPHKH